jgi:hypothetical protein
MLLIPIILISNIIGLYKKDDNNPIQNELHSGHINGRLIYGILDIKFLTDLKISEKLHM